MGGVPRRWVWYWVPVLVIVMAYGATVTPLWQNRDWGDDGPLSLHQAALEAPLPGAASLETIHHRCWEDDDVSAAPRSKIVGGTVRGQPYYACYDVDEDDVISFAEVWSGDGKTMVTDDALIKEGGAWRWVGLVKTVGELWLGAAGIVAAAAFGFIYYYRRRPGPPANPKLWQRSGLLITLGCIPVLGWMALGAMPGVSRGRKQRAFLQAVVVWGAFLSLAVFDMEIDTLSTVVLAYLGVTVLYVLVAANLELKPAGWGWPDDEPEASDAEVKPRRPKPVRSKAVTPPAPPPSPPQQQPSEQPPFDIERPASLPSFAAVGGMEELKAELRETIGLMLAFSGEAEAYRITWNGLLLHGPPGVGKTFVARAVAGEFGLNFISVSAGELVSAFRGESSRNVEEAFRFAACNVPCVLFFDEFDSVAENRQDWPDQEARRSVGQLLQSLEEYRGVRELIVMAATNHLEELDPAVIRPGRFDRHIRVDLPDKEAREAIFAAHLKDRPVARGIDYRRLAERSAGLTPAAIAQVVERAALTAFKQAAATGDLVKITEEGVETALDERGGKDRPTIEDWTWDALVLDPETKAELQELQFVIEDPDSARALGVEPPTGVLLTGPPGTGKTTVAKVLAAQANCSFYPVSAGDLTSMWLGESEKSVQRLFARARENRPSVIFIDEIDAIASKRGQWGSYDRQINELLQQMDGVSGQQGVLVLAATNRPDQLDPALLRGGRLSRTIEIPLPDRGQRLQLLKLFTAKMPLARVDLDAVADRTDGASGADLRALCQQAGLEALVSARREGKRPRRVTMDDMDEALEAFNESRAAQRAASKEVS